MNVRVLIVVILVAIAAVLYIALPGGEEENSHQRIIFNREVALVAPPPELVQTGDMLTRLLDRLTWGTSASVNRTIDMLAGLDAAEAAREAAARIKRFRSQRPAAVKVYVDLLAELQAPEALPVLLDCARDASDMVRRAAIRALSSFKDPQTTAEVAAMARHAEGPFLFSCLAILAGRTAPAVEDLYAELIAERRDLQVVQAAIEGLGNFDTERSRAVLIGCLEDSNLDVRTAALGSLLRLKDEGAVERLTEMLQHEGPVRRINGVQLLAETDWLPSLEVLLPLADDPLPRIRGELALSLLEHLKASPDSERQKALAVLQDMLDDAQPEVRLQVIQGLYIAGQTSVALPYLSRISRAVGSELAEAVEVAASLLKCPQALTRLEERFTSDPNLTADDRLAILTGLAAVADPQSTGLFFQVIRGEWGSRNAMVGEFPLAWHAAFKVHALGAGVWAEWERYLRESDGSTAAYLYINGVRNLGDPRAAETLLALAEAPDLPRSLREEAIRSFACFEFHEESARLAAGALLRQFQVRSKDAGLGALAMLVFWNYY